MIESYFLSAALFCLGLWGLLLRRNIISILICLNLMLLSTIFMFALMSRSFGVEAGQSFAFYGLFFIMLWNAISLAMAINFYRKTKTLRTDHVDLVM